MISGNLFARDYLLEGIQDTAAWKSLANADLADLRKHLVPLATAFLKIKKPTEAETERDFIYPVLEALGWSHVQVQQNLSVKGRGAIPDALLFADAAAKQKAVSERDHWKRHRYGLALVEAKRWDRPLDRTEHRRDAPISDASAPSTQMLQYLSRVDAVTQQRLRLGILTNGRKWRLYFQGALSVAEDFFEVDLSKALELRGYDLDLLDAADKRLTPDHALRLFLLMFGKAAFIAGEGGRTFHELSRDAGKTWEERVAKDLSRVVFTRLFPTLVDALYQHDPQRPATIQQDYLEQVRQSALVLLYRLLFVVYAEDRDLLPDQHEGYKPYSLTKLRHEIAEAVEQKKTLSHKATIYWGRLSAVFKAIADGDDALGVPPYNGGLFAKENAPLLKRVQLPDSVLAEVVFGLSHENVEGRLRYINYRDLSVQQLGSVYERILEYGVRLDGKRGDEHVAIDADDAARHEFGSYYTPDSLVMLIIEKAIGPLVAERLAAFNDKARELAKDKRSKDQRLVELSALDPATRILQLKICDPAMGSGHFLVSLVDWLADRVLAAMSEAEDSVEWSEGTYRSPLSHEIVRVRTEIVQQAEQHKWPIVSEKLEDRHIVRRMVLKRCVYGVDKNPMAVELAKVALWLHTFTVGAPLSFLDHHLRCGNSLFGSRVRPAMDRLVEWGSPLLMDAPRKRALGAASAMQTIEKLTDADIAEVSQSKNLFDGIEFMTSELVGLLSLVETIEWQGPTSQLDKATVQAWTKGNFGEPLALLKGSAEVKVPPPPQESDLEKKKREITGKHKFTEHETASQLQQWLPDLRRLLQSESFLHWQVAFPGVWSQWESAELHGGFDAIIGNPPYVRQESLSTIKRALKRSFPNSHDGAADLYIYFYDQGLALLKPGGRLSFVVTNKWMRAEYAENLRRIFSEKAWIEFVADFGHAKKFFPDADVFPSVLVIRKPDHDKPAPTEAQVCVIPRDEVPEKGLSEAVSNPTYSFSLLRTHFTKDSWTLERPEVVALMDKIKRNGIPLVDLAGCKPYRGVLTGFNQAFLIDATTRDRLVAEDASAGQIIKPYLRGQDVDRWSADWRGLWMIFARRGIDIECYPSIKRHLQRYRVNLEPRPSDWKPSRSGEKWSGRKEGVYKWYEIQDAIDYWPEFSKPKIIYQEIQFHPSYALDREGRYGNNKTFILPTDSLTILATLNSPIVWWFNWRFLPHMKDEALSPVGFKMVEMPMARFRKADADRVSRLVEDVIEQTVKVKATTKEICDWLNIEFGVSKPKSTLAEPAALDADAFVVAVRDNLPKKYAFTAAKITELRREHKATIEPARKARDKIFYLEQKLSDLVNKSYGLTPEEVDLMWRTAPPRMPFTPAGLAARSDSDVGDED